MKHIMFAFLTIGCLAGAFFVIQAVIGSQNVMQQCAYACIALAVAFIPFSMFVGVSLLSPPERQSERSGQPKTVNALNE